MEPDVRRILLLDGRSVLGWDEWQRMEESHGLPVVIAGLTAAMAAGEIEQQPAAPLAHLLVGAVNEAAFVTAASSDPRPLPPRPRPRPRPPPRLLIDP